MDATFTKLVSGDIRELQANTAGGSVTELATYPLLAIVKLLGTNFVDINSYSYFDEKSGIDLFTKMNIEYKGAIATAKVGLGVKSEGDLIISGTKGYIYVPAPWWKTEFFEVRYEDSRNNNKNYHKFEGDGLRYELSDFVSMIRQNETETYKLSAKESIAIIEVIENFLKRENVKEI